MRKYKKNQRLEVYFYDIVADPKWIDEKEMDKEPDALCSAMGYYHHHDKIYLYLSPMINSETRDKTTIPLGCIKKVFKLEVSSP